MPQQSTHTGRCLACIASDHAGWLYVQGFITNAERARIDRRIHKKACGCQPKAIDLMGALRTALDGVGKDRWTLYFSGDGNELPKVTTHDTKAAIAAYEHAKQTAPAGTIVTLYRNDVPERRITIR